MDLALNNQQRLICHKTNQPIKTHALIKDFKCELNGNSFVLDLNLARFRFPHRLPLHHQHLVCDQNSSIVGSCPCFPSFRADCLPYQKRKRKRNTTTSFTLTQIHRLVAFEVNC